MSTLYTIMAFIIVLGIIVIVHELGHFLAAKLMGVRVETFSFGMGKRLIGKKIAGTDFRISIFPIGGYVKMAGEEDYESSDPKPDEFQSKNRGQKIFILIMGPLMNVLLSFFILTGIHIDGFEIERYKTEPPIIAFVSKGSAAEKAGIIKGDLILSIEGKKINNWKYMELIIGSNSDEEVEVEFKGVAKPIKH